MSDNKLYQPGIFDPVPAVARYVLFSLTENGWTTFFRGLGNDNSQGSVVAKYLTGTLDAKKVCVVQDDSDYGVFTAVALAGVVAGPAILAPIPLPPVREVYLLQRTKGAQGRGLGKTSGWVHRASLKAKGVHQLSGVNYERVDDDGLHISFGSDHSEPRLLAVDNVVICAGQESVRDLADGLRRTGVEPHVIGGADVAAEIDAKRAIRQGTELAARL